MTTSERMAVVSELQVIEANAQRVEFHLSQGNLRRAMDFLTRVQHKLRDLGAATLKQEEGLYPSPRNADSLVHVDKRYFDHLRACEKELIAKGMRAPTDWEEAERGV